MKSKDEELNWVLFPYTTSEEFLTRLESLVGILSWAEIHFIIKSNLKHTKINSLKFFKTYAPKVSKGLVFISHNDVFRLVSVGMGSLVELRNLYVIDKKVLNIYYNSCLNPFTSLWEIIDYNGERFPITRDVGLFDFVSYYADNRVQMKESLITDVDDPNYSISQFMDEIVEKQVTAVVHLGKYDKY